MGVARIAIFYTPFLIAMDCCVFPFCITGTPARGVLFVRFRSHASAALEQHADSTRALAASPLMLESSQEFDASATRWISGFYLFSATSLKQALAYAAFSIEPKEKPVFLHRTARNSSSQIMGRRSGL
jgi:hypothetical protein